MFPGEVRLSKPSIEMNLSMLSSNGRSWAATSRLQHTFSTLTRESFHDDDRHFRPFKLILFHDNSRPHKPRNSPFFQCNHEKSYKVGLQISSVTAKYSKVSANKYLSSYH